MNYKLYIDKKENFECQLKIEGASLRDAKSRMIIESDDFNLMFDGTIDNSGKCVVPISRLKGLLREGTKGTMKLEVIAEDTLFTPWESDFEVEASKKVTVEVKSQTTKKPIVETKVKVNVKNFKKPPTTTEKHHVINLLKLLIY